MNHLMRYEIKAGIKPFLFWTLGLACLVIAGMFKFIGFSAESGADINVLFGQFPKIILAMLGMANVDVQTLGGFYAVLENYTLIITSIFAIHLGANAVSREMIDKTYEFLFTKPCTRAYVLRTKLGVGLFYLCLFSLFNLLFSFAALWIHGIENTIHTTIYFYALNSFLVGLIFFTLAAALSAFMSRSEWGVRVSNAAFILAYILSVFFDIAEEPGLMKLITPLRYFEAKDLLQVQFDPFYAAVAVILSIVFLIGAFWAFRKKDLKAV